MKLKLITDIFMILLLFMITNTESSYSGSQDDLSTIPMTSDNWDRMSNGAWEETAEGIKFYSCGYRGGNCINSKTIYNFIGSELFVKWKVNCTTFSWVNIGIFDILKTGILSTHHSYGGSTSVLNDLWYYSRIKVNSDKTYTVFNCTGDYDINGGNIIRSESGTITDDAWKITDKTVVSIGFNDTYQGTDAFMIVKEVRTNAIPAEIKWDNRLLYDFESSSEIPEKFSYTDNWKIDNTGCDSLKSLYIKTDKTSGITLDASNAVLISFRIKHITPSEWDQFRFYIDERNKYTVGGTQSGEWSGKLTFAVPEGAKIFEWKYLEETKYSGQSSGASCWLDDIEILFKAGAPPDIIEKPTVKTVKVNFINQTTSVSEGEVISNGGAEVTARGVCWATKPNPTTENNHTTDGTGTGTFTSLINDLTPDTTYYIRAYATNIAGTGYGNEISVGIFHADIIYSETFTTDPNYTSLSQDHAYWDSQNGNYYVKTFDNLEYKYWAHSPQFRMVDSNRDFKIELDVNFVNPNFGTYPQINFYNSVPLNRTDPYSFSIVMTYTNNYYKKLSFISSGVNNNCRYYTPSITDNEWYHVKISYYSELQKADIIITNVNTGNKFYENLNADFPITDFCYTGIGYYDTPNYGNQWSPIRIDNIFITQKSSNDDGDKPDIKITPDSHNFGEINVGKTTSDYFLIENIGQDNLETGSIIITGTNASEFIIQDNNCSNKSIAPSNFCIFEVLFSPITEGEKIAAINIPSNDPDTPTLTIQLNGRSSLKDTVKLFIPDSRGKSGKQVKLPINIANADGLKISGLDIYLKYDSNVLIAKDIEKTPLSSGYTWGKNLDASGIVHAIFATSAGEKTVYGEGSLLYVVFDVKGTKGSTTELKFQPETIIYEPGDDYRPVAVNLDLNDIGTFIVDEKYTLGDLNGDGNINSADIIMALHIAVGNIEPTDIEKDAGDVSGDGIIRANDASPILRIALNLPLAPESSEDKRERRASSVNVSIPNTVVSKECDIWIPVQIDNAEDIAGADIILNYDSSVITAAESRTTTLTQNFNLKSNYQTGQVTLALSSMESSVLTKGAGSLVEVRFTTQQDILKNKIYPLTLTSAHLNDTYGRDFAASALQISVTSTNGSITAGEPGDTDHSGNIDLKDAVLYLKILAGINENAVYKDADINCDGKIGLEEIVYILQKTAKIR